MMGREILSDDSWRRHANPWSVITRFAAIPAGAVAVWSRDWIGWWAVVPVLAVIAWLYFNTRVFAPVDDPRTWVSQGIYGERLWLAGQPMPAHLRVLNLALIALGFAGLVGMGWGLYWLDAWYVVAGALLTTIGQVFRIMLFARLWRSTQSLEGGLSRPSVEP